MGYRQTARGAWIEEAEEGGADNPTTRVRKLVDSLQQKIKAPL
jgi:hypothetical protein